MDRALYIVLYCIVLYKYGKEVPPAPRWIMIVIIPNLYFLQSCTVSPTPRKVLCLFQAPIGILDERSNP